MRFLPQLLGNGWGLRVGVEMGTYWRPTVPNTHASPKVRCAVSVLRRYAVAVVAVAAVAAVAGRGKLKNVRLDR